jgi:hypothetical protein
MNQFLQDNLTAIILFLLLIILLLIALIGVVIVKLLLSPKNETPIQPSAPIPAPPVQAIKEEIIEVISKYKKLSEERVEEKYFCENHPAVPSAGACLICEEVFCEKCLIEHDGLYFCKEHFKTFTSNKWKQITDTRTTPNTPEDGLYIYHFKRNLWKERSAPSFVLTHYKINIEEDFIESFIQLNVLEKDAEFLAKEIEEFKIQH